MDDRIIYLIVVSKGLGNISHYNMRLVKELILHIFEVIEQKESVWVVKAQEVVWRLKTKDIKCLWYKCGKKAENCTHGIEKRQFIAQK